MAEGKETGFFRSASGVVFEMDLPLSEPLQYQADRGQLVRVNEDGSAYGEHVPRAKPAANASKAEWVGYAVEQGMSLDDAEALTRNDLAEHFKN
jgi:hypothetical protein